jgi:hypothetical protein
MNILKINNVFSSTAAFLLLSAGVISTLCFQSSEIKMIRNTSANLSNEQILSRHTELQKHLKIIKNTPPLGFRNLMADGVFLNFVQYFSSVSEQADVHQHLSPDFFEAIIALDPFYRDYYLFLSSSTTMYAAQPQKTVEIMAKGLAAINNTHPLSDSFYIWRYKGVDELLFLGNSQAAQKSFERAADWAEQSDAPDSGVMGRLSRQTADFLANDPDSNQAQISAWSSVLSNALNDTIRDRAVRRIRELGGRVEIQENGTIQIGTVETSDSSKLEKPNG